MRWAGVYARGNERDSDGKRRRAQPAGAGRFFISQVGAASARGVASVGRGGVSASAGREQADSAGHWRGVVPLVPRDGPGIVRRPGDGEAHQRALRGGEGGPGRAAGRGLALPGGGAVDQRAGGMAADGVSDAGRAAVLWGDVFSARRPLRAAGLRAGAGDHGAGVEGAARRGAGVGRRA